MPGVKSSVAKTFKKVKESKDLGLSICGYEIGQRIGARNLQTDSTRNPVVHQLERGWNEKL